eukprot:4033979-Pleurochrysis_carterae.AAC.1
MRPAGGRSPFGGDLLLAVRTSLCQHMHPAPTPLPHPHTFNTCGRRHHELRTPPACVRATFARAHAHPRRRPRRYCRLRRLQDDVRRAHLAPRSSIWAAATRLEPIAAPSVSGGFKNSAAAWALA